MNISVETQGFLKRHNFTANLTEDLYKKIVEDMKKGLAQAGSDQAMIKAGSAAIREIKEGESAIVIDAGGTNFRSCLVTKTKMGIEISDFQKTSMPAIDRELNKNEFYEAIANNISRLKDLSDKITFCFSYAMTITEDGDGKIIRFSKEVKAKEAVGTYLGKELLAELKIQGWKKIKKINVLNDTTALLLSSFVEASEKTWGSHLAFILGTGMNSAYIQNNRIIVTECGMFSSLPLPQSDFDLTVCSRTTQPSQSLLEKMCSGAYMGDIATEMVKSAVKEGLFAPDFIAAEGFETRDFDAYFLKADKLLAPDQQKIKELLYSIISRSAELSAQAIYSAYLLSDKEKGELPVCITCNGSTFWKTPLLKEKVESRLKDLLPLAFEIIQIDDDITKGSFAAAFIQ